MMNKISEVQELKLFLHDARTDRGEKFAEDLEQVTIELKLDEFVRQHIAQIKQQEQEENDDLVVNNYRQSTTNAALSSSSGKQINDSVKILSHAVFILKTFVFFKIQFHSFRFFLSLQNSTRASLLRFESNSVSFHKKAFSIIQNYLITLHFDPVTVQLENV